ncbi:6234_t:CDS:2, partial [Paraglomus brasilianum]
FFPCDTVLLLAYDEMIASQRKKGCRAGCLLWLWKTGLLHGFHRETFREFSPRGCMDTDRQWYELLKEERFKLKFIGIYGREALDNAGFYYRKSNDVGRNSIVQVEMSNAQHQEQTPSSHNNNTPSQGGLFENSDYRGNIEKPELDYVSNEVAFCKLTSNSNLYVNVIPKTSKAEDSEGVNVGNTEDEERGGMPERISVGMVQ